MNKKYIDGSFFDTVKKWEAADPTFRQAVEEHKEKVCVADLVKKARIKEELSQVQLAKKAGVTQSVIARLESQTAKTLPRLDLLTKVLRAMNYRLIINADKAVTA